MSGNNTYSVHDRNTTENTGSVQYRAPDGSTKRGDHDNTVSNLKSVVYRVTSYFTLSVIGANTFSGTQSVYNGVT